MQLRHALREWQVEALAAWRDQGRSGIIEVVTGGGKTIFAHACIVDALSAHADARILISVPTLALVDQWFVSLQEDLGVDAAEIAVHSGTRKPPRPLRFNVMVMNTARAVAPTLAAKLKCMLIVDECHRVGSEKNAAALRANYVATLGLSATPERQYDTALDTVIVPALGPVVYRYGLAAARADGVVTPFHLTNVEVELLADEQKKYDQLTRRIGKKLAGHRNAPTADLPEDVTQLLRLRARIASKASMRVPVTVRLADNHRGQRLMIFHEDIQCLTNIVHALKERNHSVTSYHTRVSPVARRGNLRLYRQGLYDVMASCRALDEGINIPETQVAIISSATATTRQRIQRLGRVLRPSLGKDRALIYTIFATESERERLLAESADLEGTATISWLKAGRRR